MVQGGGDAAGTDPDAARRRVGAPLPERLELLGHLADDPADAAVEFVDGEQLVGADLAVVGRLAEEIVEERTDRHLVGAELLGAVVAHIEEVRRIGAMAFDAKRPGRGERTQTGEVGSRGQVERVVEVGDDDRASRVHHLGEAATVGQGDPLERHGRPPPTSCPDPGAGPVGEPDGNEHRDEAADGEHDQHAARTVGWSEPHEPSLLAPSPVVARRTRRLV